MKLHRYNGQPEPYKLTFEVNPETQYYEQIVARNALMLSPFDIDRIGLEAEEATAWAERGFALSARNNGDFLTNQTRLNREELRRFGGLLAYFSDITFDEMRRIAGNNPPSKDVFANRLYEGKLASDMHTVIESRIRVPKLWKPNTSKSFGFSK